LVYDDACKWLRLKHIVYGTALKNFMDDLYNESKIKKKDAICSTMFGIG
jgi:hypothetical protein